MKTVDFAMVTENEPETLPGADSDGEEVSFHGSIYRIRKMSDFAFVIIRTAKELVQTVYDQQTAKDKGLSLDDFSEGDIVVVRGVTKHEERSKRGYDIILYGLDKIAFQTGEAPLVINKNQIDTSLSELLDNRSYSLRNQYERSIFLIQEGISRAFREYLHEKGFTEIHTPKIVSGNAEGGAEVFNLKYFDKDAFLSQSPQFYKQAMVGVFERVFEIGPVFRAEKHDTSRHLNEYTGLDFEMGFINSYEDVMKMEMGFLHYVNEVLEKEYADAIKTLQLKLPNVEKFAVIPFMEAKDILKNKCKYDVKDYHDFEPAEEDALCQYYKKTEKIDYVFVTEYPSDKRPFYAMDDPKNPGFTLSFDLLFRGLEVTTGGQRINNYEMQVEKMKARGMNPDDFSDFLLIHKTGMPPHGGLGIGLERLTAKMIGFDNVRRCCLYPRDLNRLRP
jgi:nondiscriminating aspartyl-tRNA synthetase